MPLIKCSGCGHQISSRADYCPKCGKIFTGAAQTNKSVSNGSQIDRDEKSSDCSQSIGWSTNNSDGKTDEEWYYVTSAGRNGPVNTVSLRKAADDGEIDDNTRIWKAGLPDWVKFSQLNEIPRISKVEEPGEEQVKATYNYSAWVVALAPLWGGILQIVATEARISLFHKKLDYYSEMWWIVIAFNVIASYLDFFNLKKSGHAVGKTDAWLCLLSPAYIYRRDKIVNANMLRFWVCIGSLSLSIVTLILLNSIYSQISSK